MLKKLISTFLCLFLVQIAIAQDNSKYLVGQWKILKLDIPTMQIAISKANPADKVQLKKELEALMKYSAFVFNHDGTYQIMMGGNKEHGTWSCNIHGSKLFTKQMQNGTYLKEQQIGMEIINHRRVVLLNEYDTGEIIKIELLKTKK